MKSGSWGVQDRGTRVSDGGTAPVLVVDDTSSKRLALAAALTPLGLPIVQADSGQAALRAVMTQDFAVILLDVRMPDVDGFETAALIRRRKESEMTPIIFVTAFAGDEIGPKSRYVSGAVDFMFAPIQPDELRAKVSVFVKLFLQAKALARQAQEVQASADQLRLLTDAAPIGIFRTDAEARLIYTNPRWSEITGIPSEEAAGRDWDTIVDSKERADLVAELAPVADPSKHSQRYEIRRPDATSRIVLVTSESIPDTEGGIAGWVGTLADITAEAGAESASKLAGEEQARLQSQLHQAKKMEAVGQLAGGIAHDFNNILSVVLNYAEFVAETLDESHAGSADIHEIIKAGKRGAELVHQLLAFSHKEDIQPVVLDLNEVVSGMAVFLARAAGEKFELDIHTQPGQLLTKADQSQIEQILLNLVVNARDSMPEGGRIGITTCDVEIEAGMRVDLLAGQYACLTVTDTGMGIDAEIVDHIFEPFFTTKPRGEGTGLGLATAYGIVKQAQGGIYADSEIGAKTSFVVYLPVTDEEVSSPVGPPLHETSGRGTTILVVEDEDPVRDLVGRILRREGFDVVAVASGAEAVEICSERPGSIDLLLSDVVMPLMSGPALSDLVQPLRPEMRVLFMSGSTDEIATKRGVLDSGHALINKPFNSDQLLTRVREVLGSQLVPAA
jgi:PAS domain S-box-containing protein